MIDYNEVFWDNVIRWQRFRRINNSEMGLRLDISKGSYVNAKTQRVGVSTRKLGKYVEALEVEPQDLFDVWTDEEWQAFVNRSKGEE